MGTGGGGAIGQGETAEAVVRRETVEEAGIVVGDLVPLYQAMACPGASSETRTMFLGKTDTRGAGGVFGIDAEHENILAAAWPLATASLMLGRGEIIDLTCIAALQWLLLHHREMRERWC
jgi:ADP-ribose pyrophosphatase